MVNIKYLAVALFLVAVGIAAYFFIFNSQELLIKKQFEFIAGKIEKAPGESPIISMARANSLTEAIAEPCLIHIPAFSYAKQTHSKEISRYVLAMRSRYSTISLIFYDFLFENMDENSGQVTVTAGLKGTLNTGDIFEDIHEVLCRVKKIEDTWKLIEIEVVDVLKK